MRDLIIKLRRFCMQVKYIYNQVNIFFYPHHRGTEGNTATTVKRAMELHPVTKKEVEEYIKIRTGLDMAKLRKNGML